MTTTMMIRLSSEYRFELSALDLAVSSPSVRSQLINVYLILLWRPGNNLVYGCRRYRANGKRKQ